MYVCVCVYVLSESEKGSEMEHLSPIFYFCLASLADGVVIDSVNFTNTISFTLLLVNIKYTLKSIKFVCDQSTDFYATLLLTGT